MYNNETLDNVNKCLISDMFVQLHQHAAVISYSELETRTLKTRL